MDDKGVLMSDAIEHDTLTRLSEVYTAALRKVLKDKASTLRKIADVDSGKIKPPDFYVRQGEEGIKRWRDGFIQQLMRQEGLIDGIMERLNEAGVEAEKLIRGSLADTYKVNHDYTVEQISTKVGDIAVGASFGMISSGAAELLVDTGESYFTKIAYANIRSNPVIQRRLQQSMAEAITLGEGQKKIIKRIRDITGMGYRQAKRVAQTEGTRVRSQARYNAESEAKDAGVNVVNEWSAQMENTRETHESLQGKKKPHGEAFVTSKGNSLLYPGDPSAPASEVINCHCVLVPDVLLPGQKLGEDGAIIESEQNADAEASASVNLDQDRIRKRREEWKRMQQNKAAIPQFDTMNRDDLMAWAATNLKTPFDSVKGVNGDFVREAVKAVAELEKRLGGNTLPGLKVHFGNVPSGAAAAYSTRTGAIHIKKTGGLQAYEETQHALNERYRRKWRNTKPYYSTESYIGGIFHELGHAVDEVLGRRYSKQLSGGDRLSRLSVGISAYASSTTMDPLAPSRVEAWAENFAAYMVGGEIAQRVPDEIVRMIDEAFALLRRRRG